jgi:hypothetical protein
VNNLLIRESQSLQLWLIFGTLDYLYCRGYFAPYVTQYSWLATGLDGFIASSFKLLDLVGGRLALSGAAIAAIIYRYGRH